MQWRILGGKTEPPNASWLYGWPGVFVFIAFGMCLLGLALPLKPPPLAQQKVSEARGQVARVQLRKGSMYFWLKGTTLAFVLHSKSHSAGRVEAVLSTDAIAVEVQYDNTRQINPAFMHGPFYSVVAISSGGHQLLSQDEIREGRGSDNLLGLLIGMALIIYGARRATLLLR